jgi:hypothetical protein
MAAQKLHGLLQPALSEQRQLDRVLQSDTPVVMDAALSLRAWAALQERVWSGAENPLLRELGNPRLCSTASDADPPPGADQMCGGVRAALFLGVLKGVLTAGTGQTCALARGDSCGVTPVCDGELLASKPVAQMTIAELRCTVVFVASAHHGLRDSQHTREFLAGLLRACALACVTVPAATGGHGVSIADLLQGVDKGRADSENLLWECEKLFGGLASDGGLWDEFFEQGASPLAPPAAPADAPAALAHQFRALVQMRAGEKHMQRLVIAERELLLSSVLCPYGTEKRRRRQLTSTSRAQLVLIYDRLSYRGVAELLSADCTLRGRHDEPRTALQAALWATVTCVMRSLGPACESWLQKRAQWGSSLSSPDPPDNVLTARRTFDVVCDSRGHVHENLLLFLAAAVHTNKTEAPCELLKALQSVA